MPRPFSRTVGLLDHEGRRFRAFFTLGAALLLAAWTVWFFKSSVTVFAVSHDARLEVDGASYPVQAPVSGRVVATTLTMGRVVNAGETPWSSSIPAPSGSRSAKNVRDSPAWRRRSPA